MPWKWATANKNGDVTESTSSEEWTGFIDQGVTLEGTLTVTGTFRIDGVIFARGRVEVQARGVVTGEVHSPCMVIDPGGIFDGRCHMLASSDAASASVTIPIRAAGAR